MKELHINRLHFGKNQTIGALTVVEDDKVLFGCWTLELPDLNNQSNISCIPSGIYNVKKRTSQKFGEHLHILGVDNRNYILIHQGNYNSDIRGCILTGLNLSDINKDGLIDVVNSRVSLNRLLKLLPNECFLKIA